MSAGPTPPGIDAALTRFRTDGAAMHAALVDLESHPGYRFLDSAALAGSTKTAWTEAKETVAQLFASAAAFRAVLDRAEQVRGKSHRVGTAELLELDDLLRGPSVVLASTEIPLAQRGLTGPATVANRVSLAELIDTMTAAHRPVAEFVTAAHAVSGRWYQLRRGISVSNRPEGFGRRRSRLETSCSEGKRSRHGGPGRQSDGHAFGKARGAGRPGCHA